MEERETNPPISDSNSAASGLADNVAGALAYVTVIPAILFLILEPYNRRPFVRFHSFQSIGLGLTWIVVSMIWVIPILGWIVGAVGLLVLFCAWILCMVKAYQGELFGLPVIGKFVTDMAKQGI